MKLHMKTSTYIKMSRLVFNIALSYIAINVHANTKTTSAIPTQEFKGKVQQIANVDEHLIETYKLISARKYDDALKKLNQILVLYPNFELAAALRSDLLTTLNHGADNINKTLVLTNQNKVDFDASATNKTIVPAYNLNDFNGDKLRLEAVKRIHAFYDRPDPKLIPRNFLYLSPRQKTALVVDPKQSRIYVYENVNGRPKFLFDYYITIGKKGIDKVEEGDNKTPIGIYELGAPIDKKKLTDFYGYGALPLNFPNEWDRRNNITGSNIWIHGVPSNTYSRPPLASQGCVVLTNTDVERLFKFIEIQNTPIVINKGTEWLEAEKWQKEHLEAKNLIKQWQDTWATYDFETYKSMYSFNLFKSDKKNYDEWMKKYQIFFEEKQVRLQTIRHLSIYRYPANEPTLLMTFEQDMMIPDVMAMAAQYSKNKNKDVPMIMKQSVMQKRQYWQYDGIRWEIVYENETEKDLKLAKKTKSPNKTPKNI
jgi:murein L,D-transpeptidase YafK